MPGMGPVPKPGAQRRRTNATIAMTKLPAEGRQGVPPAWPLPYPPDAHETALWEELWATPQAVAWERQRWTRVVARYVVTVIAAEHPLAKNDTRAEARQLEDRLGLTPMSMLRLRWEVVEDELGAARGTSSTTSSHSSHPAGSGRRRLLAIDPNATAQG